MRPVRLELHNFLAYCDPMPLSFEGLDIACLSGPNGAGKSSLLDALTWALWGRSRVPGGRTDDMLIHMGQDEMYVVLDFWQDGHLYRVRREHRRGKVSRSALAMWIWKEDEGWSSLTEQSRETQDKINRLLRLDYETFVDSAFIRQGRADSFTAKTPAERKKLLMEILTLKRWEGYEAQAKKLLEDINNELKIIDATIKATLAEEGEESRLLTELEQAKTQQATLHDQVEAARALHESLAGSAAELKAAQAQLQAIQRRIKEFDTDNRTITDELAAQHRRLEKFNQTLAQQAEIEAGYARLQEVRALFEELDEKSRQYNSYEKQAAALQHAINTERTKLEAQIARHDDRIGELKLEIDQLPGIRHQISTLDARLAEAEALVTDKAGLIRRQGTHAEEIGTLKATNDNLRAQMNDIKHTLDNLGGTVLVKCPTCGQPLSESHRDELQHTGKTMGDAWRVNNRRINELEQARAADTATIDSLDKQLKDFDRYRDQRGALQERMTSAEKAAERLEAERNAIAEVRTMLDYDNYANDAREQLTHVIAAADALNYDQDSHAQIREALKEYRPFDTRLSELRNAQESLADLQAAIQQAEDRRERLLVQMQQERNDEKATVAHIKTLSGLATEAQQHLMEAKRLQQLEREANDKRVRLEQQLSAIASARQRKLELEAQRGKLKDEAAIYRELIDAFGKNGVPALMIEAAIPELEESTNRILARMTDGKMAIRFDTQRTNKSGDTVETLDILISDELGQRMYDMYSGGEGFRINFALRVALSQFLARRAGARLQTLVIDEGFGSQDAVGRERIVEAINAIKDDFDLILIVTHIEELLDLFPTRIDVRKTPHGSTLALR